MEGKLLKVLKGHGEQLKAMAATVGGFSGELSDLHAQFKVVQFTPRKRRAAQDESYVYSAGPSPAADPSPQPLATAAAAAAAAPLSLQHSSHSLSTITGLTMVDAQVRLHRSGKATWEALWEGKSQGFSELKKVMAVFDGYLTRNERVYLQAMSRASPTYIHELTSMWEIATLRFMHDLRACEVAAKLTTEGSNQKRGKAIVGGIAERLYALHKNGGNDPRLSKNALDQVGCGDTAFLNSASTRVVTGMKVKKPLKTAMAKAVAKVVKAAGQAGKAGQKLPKQSMAQRVVGALTSYLVPKGSSSSS